MKISTFLRCIIFSILVINVDAIKAQTDQGLDDRQQSIVSISALMVRIAEIEIFPRYRNEYNAILKEEAAKSVEVEPGVIAIIPTYQKENPVQIRILEIYANNAAYEQHLKTPHFQKYKTSTLKMVKSLKLVEVVTIDSESLPVIFRKLK